MSHKTKVIKLDTLSAALIDALRSYSYSFGSEAVLQACVATVLAKACLPHAAEVKLGAGDRVDFLVDGRIAVELKVDGSVNEVARQLARYCRHDQVEAVVLVTSRRKHFGVPPMLAGKPIEVVHVREGLA